MLPLFSLFNHLHPQSNLPWNIPFLVCELSANAIVMMRMNSINSEYKRVQLKIKRTILKFEDQWRVVQKYPASCAKLASVVLRHIREHTYMQRWEIDLKGFGKVASLTKHKIVKNQWLETSCSTPLFLLQL